MIRNSASHRGTKWTVEGCSILVLEALGSSDKILLSIATSAGRPKGQQDAHSLARVRGPTLKSFRGSHLVALATDLLVAMSPVRGARRNIPRRRRCGKDDRRATYGEALSIDTAARRPTPSVTPGACPSLPLSRAIDCGCNASFSRFLGAPRAFVTPTLHLRWLTDCSSNQPQVLYDPSMDFSTC